MKRTVKTATIIICALAIVLIALIAIPFVKTYSDPDEFKLFIESCGMWGVAVMLIIQLFQVVVAIIPGEVVEFVSGAMYGWFGGLVLCMAGVAVGQLVIFKLVRFFGKDFAENIAGGKTMKKFKFLQDEKKLKTLLFFLFLIPGTPKDVLTYIVPLTKIKLGDFIAITLIARLPSIISSTYAGDVFADRNFIKLAVVYVVIGIFSVIGMIIYRILEAKHARKHKSDSK